jgi:hypothetical protein
VPQLSPDPLYGARVTEPTPLAPVFGKHPEPFDARRFRPFGIEVEDDTHRWTEHFQAFTDVDGGALVSLLNANGELAVAQAVVRFLGTNLVDSDGVSMDWNPPAQPEPDPDNPDEWLRAEPTDDSTVAVEGGELIPQGEPLYRWHDGSLMTSAELTAAWREFDELRDGSSRRRFAVISDSMHMRYRIEALSEIAEWLAPQLTARPTLLPGRSGPGQSPGGRGSGARRRAN